MAIKDVLVVRQSFMSRGVNYDIGAVIDDAVLIADMLVEQAEKVIPAKHDIEPASDPAPAND
jgi:hypothetical protein